MGGEFSFEQFIGWIIEFEPQARVFTTYLGALSGLVGLLAAIVGLTYAIWNQPLTRFWRIAYTALLTVGVLMLTSVVVAGIYYVNGIAERVTQTRVQQIRNLVESEDYDRALAQLDALRADEQGPEVLVLRCEILVRRGQGDSASQYCGRVLQQEVSPDLEFAARFWYARAMLTKGSWAEAKTEFTSILSVNSVYAPALAGRCEAMLRLGELLPAFQDCTKVLELVGDAEVPDADNDVERARALRCEAATESHLADNASDRLEIDTGVRRDCLAVVKARPKSASALARACFAVLELNRRDGTPPDLQYCAVAHDNLGFEPAFERERLYAIECYGFRLGGALEEATARCSVATKPGQTPGYFVEREICAISLYQKDFRRAQEHCTAAILRNQKPPEIFNYRCIASFWLGELKEASSDCAEAIRRDPAFALAHKNLCRVHYWRKNYDEAMSSCREALRLRKLGPRTTPEALSYLCRMRIFRNEPADDCDTAEQLNRKEGQPYLSGFALVGKCQLTASRSGMEVFAETACTTAIEAFETCRQYQPAVKFDAQRDFCPSGVILDRMTAEAYVARARVRLARQATAEAAQDLATARQYDPENASVPGLAARGKGTVR